MMETTLEKEYRRLTTPRAAAVAGILFALLFAASLILLRSAIQARPFEEKLRFFEIPYTIIGGRSFFDRREIRDSLAAK